MLCCTASVGQCALAKIDLTTNQQFNALTVKDFNKSILTDNYLFWFAKTLKQLTAAGMAIVMVSHDIEFCAENADIAAERPQPICQDTGMACVFVELGQEVHIAGDLNEAIHAGVRRGYTDGFLRKSVVRDPLDRVNTGDNTPAMIYYEIVPGDRLKLTVAPKGFGSENMSRIAMLRPSDGLDGVKQFVLDAVLQAGPNPCPPTGSPAMCVGMESMCTASAVVLPPKPCGPMPSALMRSSSSRSSSA